MGKLYKENKRPVLPLTNCCNLREDYLNGRISLQRYHYYGEKCPPECRNAKRNNF